MKDITFRPLRRIKKSGKIVVESYMQWRKLMTADYDKFNLTIGDEYKSLPPDEFVHNHKGELLFFYKYNPADIPVYDSEAQGIIDDDWLHKLHESYAPHGIRWKNSEGHVNYNVPGMDCDGVPVFSHCTQDYVAEYYKKVENFEPLTVKTVVHWFGWIIYQLNNSYLKIGK